jgi:hypothetical protein
MLRPLAQTLCTAVAMCGVESAARVPLDQHQHMLAVVVVGQFGPVCLAALHCEHPAICSLVSLPSCGAQHLKLLVPGVGLHWKGFIHKHRKGLNLLVCSYLGLHSRRARAPFPVCEPCPVTNASSQRICLRAWSVAPTATRIVFSNSDGALGVAHACARLRDCRPPQLDP